MMRTNNALWLVIFFISALLLGCSDDEEGGLVDPDGNHPPVIEQQADTFAMVWQMLELQAHASDADGDTLEYSAVVHASWSEIMGGYVPDIDMNGETGLCQFVPSDDDVPERSITFYVDDHNGGLDSTTFVVTVNE
jgi:hypothetical protein